MPVAQLKEFLAQHGGSAKGALERADLEDRARRLVAELAGSKCVGVGACCGWLIASFDWIDSQAC